jgi:hypothetical protein
MSQSSRSPQQVDLTKLFTTVTKTLKENQASLNAADDENHNHGDNMVQSFQLISKATREMKGSSPSRQLAHAGEVLAQNAQSGSAQLYAEGLTRAAQQLQGQRAITQENGMLLVQSLMGGGQAAPQGGPSALTGDRAGGGMTDLLGSLLGGQGGQSAGSGDMLGGLLGTLMGGEPAAPQQQQNEPAAGGDMLGGLLGTLLGGGQAPSQQGQQGQTAQAAGGIDLNTLMAAGMAFFQARQKGAAPMQAVIQAVLAGSQMMASPRRAQSGQLVAESLLNSLSNMLAK